MKTKILNIDGKETKEIELPEIFSGEIREDIVAKVLEAKKEMHPYSPSLVAGKQQNAKGQIVHRRHVWKTGYGRGMSRTPRKTMSRRGTQFNWVGAYAPNTRGGFRAHPPKVLARINTSKVNKKELKIAFESAIAATASPKELIKKYSTIEKEHKKLPIVVENEIVKLKIKKILESLRKILGDELFNVAIRERNVRAGKGKLRGRKYKSNAGMILIIGKNEKLKTNAFKVKNADKLNIFDLAQGGLGRLAVYTENAVREIGEKK